MMFTRARQPRPLVETLPGPRAPAAGRALRAMTWNLHFGIGPGPYGEHRRGADEVLRALGRVGQRARAEGVELLLVQELDRLSDRSGGVDQLLALREASGLEHAAFVTTWARAWVPFPLHLHPSRQYGRVWSGQAVLSTLPVTRNLRHALPKPPANGRVHNHFYRQACVQEVGLDPGGGRRLTVLNVHLEAFDVANRRHQARLLARQMTALEGPALMAGDLNAIPPEAHQRYGFIDEPDEDHRGDDSLSVLRATGWTELGDGAPTFPAGAETRRLDHAFCSPGLRARGGHVLHPDPPISDHRPLLFEVDLHVHNS